MVYSETWYTGFTKASFQDVTRFHGTSVNATSFISVKNGSILCADFLETQKSSTVFFCRSLTRVSPKSKNKCRKEGLNPNTGPM
jgi:hypothetical protein